MTEQTTEKTPVTDRIIGVFQNTIEGASYLFSVQKCRLASEIERRRNDIEIILGEEGVPEEGEEEEGKKEPTGAPPEEIVEEVFRRVIGISMDDLSPSEKRDIEQIINEMT